MTIPGSLSSPLLASAAGAAGAFEISRSLRFNSGDSAHLSRTPSAAGNRRTWTWSAWVKLSSASTARSRFFGASGAFSGSPYNFALDIGLVNNKIVFTNYANDIYSTDAVFRDFSAWYHIVVALDTTDSTTANRVKIYVNGILQNKTFGGHSGSAEPTQNIEYPINDTKPHALGATVNTSGVAIHPFDGYLAEINFIDGSALGPSSFGDPDANGVWQAKDTSGLTFGTNGFRLKFADNSGSTATTLGKDTSGNSNNWTPNNLSAVGGIPYSSYVTGSPYSSLYTAAEAFDGNANTGNMSLAAGGATMTFTPPNAIAVTSSLRIWGAHAGSGGDLTINGSSVGSQIANTYQWNTISITGITSITSIAWSSVNGNSAFLVGAIEVDGVILVDGAAGDNDSLVDTPSNGDTASDTGSGGQITGNYATWNPLDNGGNTLKDGNLVINGADKNCKSTIAVSSGKWYFEQTGRTSPGIALASTSAAANTDNYQYQYDGNLYHLSGGSYTTTSGGASFGEGDIIGVALDLDNNQLKLYKNGALQSALTKTIAAGTYCFMARSFFNTDHPSNFGQRAFAYTAPSGYKSLNTANLPTPTIADGSQYFNAAIWSGDGTNNRNIPTGHSTDLVWVKRRNSTNNHTLTDIIRGVNVNLRSSTTGAESTDPNSVTSFDADGFSVGSDGAFNGSGGSFVGWSWDAGTSTVTNNDGSIASQVRASAASGFSIVKYVGTGSLATVGHSLNSAVEFMIIKGLDDPLSWAVYANSPSNYLELSNTGASNSTDASNAWNGTAPTSSVFTVKSKATVNESAENYIAFCFAPVNSYSAMGSYTGNGSTDGPFVALSFRPALIILKRTDASSDWYMFDTARNSYNSLTSALFPNDSASEATNGVYAQDFVSNGWKIRSSQTQFNASGGTYIYYAVAENPFQANGGLAR